MASTSDLVKIYEQARNEVDTRITLVRHMRSVIFHVLQSNRFDNVQTICEENYFSRHVVYPEKVKFSDGLMLCRDCLKILREEFVP